MIDGNPGTTFRGLPLTDGQDSEIKHYIHAKKRSGKQWDTPELQQMLADMLDPPELVGDDTDGGGDSVAAERATAQREEHTDPEGQALQDDGAWRA